MCLLVEGLGRWRPLQATQPARCTRYKGYVHQSNHAPAALQAEALRVQVLICRDTHSRARVQLSANTDNNAVNQTLNGLTFGDHSVENVSQLVSCNFHVLPKEEPEGRRRKR